MSSELITLLDELNYKRKLAAMRKISTFGLHFRQLPIVDYIMEHDCCTQNEIAEYLGITPASIAISTKRLQKAGMIEKHISEDNLRCKHLSVTEKGMETAKKCKQALDLLDNKMLEGFTKEETEQLSHQLRRIISALPEKDMPDSILERIAEVNKFRKDDE